MGELYGDRIQKDGGATPIGANGLPLRWEDTITGKFSAGPSVHCGQEPVCGVPTGS